MFHNFLKYFSLIVAFLCALHLLPAASFAANSHTVNNGATKTIDEHGVCKKITNGSGSSIMVPTKAAAEWSSFRSNLPAGVTKASCVNSYFVLAGARNGSMGGLSGANSWCYTQLNAQNWKGKATSNVGTASKVKAFLCGGSCNNLQANTKYFFATAGSTTKGGGSFTTNGSGRGPGDSVDWRNGNRFNSGVVQIWTGREWGGGGTYWSNGGDVARCSNWTTTGASGRVGYTDSGGYNRWADDNGWGPNRPGCGGNNRVICFVNQ